jgi:hypothetical protein
LGVPVHPETNEIQYGLNNFLKIKAVTLASQGGVKPLTTTVKPPSSRQGGKINSRLQNKKDYLDSSFGDSEKNDYDHNPLRRSFSGSKAIPIEFGGAQVMSDIEEEQISQQRERNVRSAASNTSEIYSMRYKGHHSPEYQLGKRFSSDEPYTVIQKTGGSRYTADSKVKANNNLASSIRFIPLNIIKESPPPSRSKTNSLGTEITTRTKLTPGVKSNNPSVVPGNRNESTSLLTSILNKNNQNAPITGQSINPKLTPVEKPEMEDKLDMPESFTPKNNGSTSPGSQGSNGKDRNEEALNTNPMSNSTVITPLPSNKINPKLPSPPIQKKVNNVSTLPRGPNVPTINRGIVQKVDDKTKKGTIIVPPQTGFKYTIGGGNNGQLVKKILSRRGWWEQAEGFTPQPNFKWQQTNKGVRFERLIPNPNYTQVFNHFEFHREISTKNCLIKNLSNYCEMNKITIFDMTPTTFVFDMDDIENFDSDMQRFSKLFIKHNVDQEKYPKPDPNDKKNHSTWYHFDYRRKKNYTLANLNDEKKVSQYLKPKFHKTFMKGFNVWVLKPTGLNRGRGIEVFNTLEALNTFINQYFEGAKRAVKKGDESGDDDEESEEEETGGKQKFKGQIFKSHTFVIQKYIENLLTVNKRKFDIRVWVLVTHDMQLYFFKEGYLRTTCYEYDLTEDNIDNKFIHLTNNAVQKHCDDYGQFESGNQLSFSDFERYLEENKIDIDVRGKIIPKMKEFITQSMNSVKKTLNLNERKYCFELFGYDFMIDIEGALWLIEVNTNPCIEESSPLLASLIPRMLDDAFKLTIDVMFPEPTKKEESADKKASPKKKGGKEESSDDESESEDEAPVPKPANLSVKGYTDEENMWDYLGSLQVQKNPVRKNVNVKQTNGPNK